MDLTAAAAFHLGFWFAAGAFAFFASLVVGSVGVLAFAGYLLRQRG